MTFILLPLLVLFSAPPPAINLSPDLVVARASGPQGPIVITATRLRDFAASRPEDSIEASLQALLDFELLAAEAQARGFAVGREVAFSRAQAMVTRYLMDVFEDAWSAAKLPTDAVKAAYRRVRGKFMHPPLRDANHILVSDNRTRPADPALDARAKVLAEKIHAQFVANPPSDGETFLARGKGFEAEAEKAGLIVTPQALNRFAFEGRYAPAFTAPVFTVNEANTLIEPFVTRFGYHVVWVNAIIPERNESFEQAEAELRTRFAPVFRKRELRTFTNNLAERYPAIAKAPGIHRLMNVIPLKAVALRRGLPEPAQAVPAATP